jgi:hypothetical protein
MAQKLRHKLGGDLQLSKPFPQKPYKMRREGYGYYRAIGEYLEGSLSRRIKSKAPDYSAHTALAVTRIRELNATQRHQLNGTRWMDLTLRVRAR